MSMLEITKAELTKYDALTPGVNQHTQKIINAIPFPTIPFKMKAVIAVSQLTNYAAQFRRNIVLWDDTEVPINAISFILTGSGTGKDSAVNAASKCFREGYEIIENHRYQLATKEAIAAAVANGEDLPNEPSIYEAYMKPLPPIDITPTTGPGLVKHVNDISLLPITSGFMYAGEFTDNFATSSDMSENITILSELYDLGIKKATYTKGEEHRTKAVQGQPVSALFVGSPAPILFDETVKKRFSLAFMSKLARRSWFCYTPEKIPTPDFSEEPDPIQAMKDFAVNLEIEAREARTAVSGIINSITNYNIENLNQNIEVADEVFHLFQVYKRYNEELADSMPNQESTSVLVRRHLQWKALKLAGAFTVFNKQDTILEHHYIEAIRFCELLDGDMARFERELYKSNHERFADYMKTIIQEDGKAYINIHDLKKRGFTAAVSKQRLNELITLAAGYDKEGVYTVDSEGAGIYYETIIKTDIIGVSYKPIDNSLLNQAVQSNNPDAIAKAKQQVASTTAYGFEVVETSFDQLGDLLREDFAYSPFRFLNGTRGRDNILGGTKWLVFDIDKSPLTAAEVHIMLSDINHHIALSSDPNNEYKFRVLLELDSSVELSHVAWKHFCLEVSTDLALNADPLPQSQIFYSYAGRPVLSNLDAEPLEVRNYVMAALEKEASKEVLRKPSSKEAKSALQDPLNTFAFAYEAPDGQGSRSMVKAAYYARSLGANLQEALTLLEDINEYWYAPMQPSRFEKLLDQVRRMYQGD